jgi:hypothetical protein
MSVLKQIKLFAFLLLVLAAGYGCYTLYQSTVPASRFSQEPTPDAVLKSVKSLARLETVTYTVEKIVDISASGPQSIIKDFLFGDKLLLIATGDVIAGVDLQRMNQSDVSISGNQITIQLPPAEIFTVGLNEPQTRVYDRKTGILSKPRNDLESEARKRAISQIRESACNGGILKKATDSAVTQITHLIPNTIINTVPSGCK